MKTAGKSESPAVCAAFHRASELIGRRWTGAIIYLLLRRPCRFAELRDGIHGITDRMLSERLHELEAEGLIARDVLPETPVRIEYSLTKKGKELAQAIDAISAWAEKWVDGKNPKARRRPVVQRR